MNKESYESVDMSIIRVRISSLKAMLILPRKVFDNT